MLVALALLACVGTPPRAERRPNVLLVTMDTTRADALGVYGNSRKPTPHLDRFAETSARFTRASTVTPLTIPTHSSIFTGLWPPRHGVRDNGDFFLGDGAITLAERLHDAGYATMASVGAEVTSHHWGFAQGFDTFYDDMGADARDVKNRWRVERRGDAVLADALPWLQQRGPEQPWFAWVHLFDAHHPYEAPEPHASAYPDLPYLAEVAYVDSLVGKLLGDLESRGELDHTWVVVMADHGEGLGSHGEMMHGVLLYDATTRIPLLVRPPGGIGGRAVDFPVSAVDITPTLLAATGAAALPTVDGIDLGPWLAAEPPAEPDRDVYIESLYAFHHYGWAPQRAIVDKDHKLIDSTTDELYARADPLERSDLAGTEAALLAAMQQRVEALATGMAPVDEASDKAQMSADRLAQLEALGYVTGDGADVEADPAAELPDPVKKLPSLRKVEGARQSLAKGDLAGAREAIEAIVAEDPGLVEVQLLLAQVLSRQGELERAEALLQELHAKGPTSNTANMLGGLYLRRGDLDAARDSLREAIELDPYLATAWVPYLTVLFMSGNVDELERESARALAKLPDEPSVLAMTGITSALRGDAAVGRASLERALALDPYVPLANHGLGVIHRHAGDAPLAEAAFLEEARLHPPGIASRRVLVEMYAEQQRFEDQLAQLDLIGAIEPTNPLTLHAKAQALFNLGRYAESLGVVEACRAAAPDYSGCALMQANALKKLGRDAEAERAWVEAQALKKAEAAPRR